MHIPPPNRYLSTLWRALSNGHKSLFLLSGQQLSAARASLPLRRVQGCCEIKYGSDSLAASRCVWLHAWECKAGRSVCCCRKPHGVCIVLQCYYQFTYHMLPWDCVCSPYPASTALAVLIHACSPDFPAASCMCMAVQACRWLFWETPKQSATNIWWRVVSWSRHDYWKCT